MKTSRSTESQIVAMLKMADARVPVNEMWRKHGISSSNGSQRTAKYGRLDASELKSAKELETGVPG